MKRIVLGLILIMVLIPAISKGETYTPEYELENKEQLQLYDRYIKEALKYAPHDDLYALRELARQTAQYLLRKAQRHFVVLEQGLTGLHFADLIEEAGYIEEYEFSIFLNEIMYLRNVSKFIKEIIPHEVAHLVAIQRDKCLVHTCNSFRSVMVYLIGYYTVGHKLNTIPSCHLNHALRLARPKACASCKLTILPRCNDL